MALPLQAQKGMVTRKLFLLLALAAFVLPSLSFAQHEHRATVLLRNGERVSGSLEDVENGVVYVRVSLHDQRKLGVAEVALIDLAGGASGLPETELSVARGANHLALLRDGSSWQGQFIDVRGGETNAGGDPHSLIFRTTNGEERRVSLDGVSRVYFGNFPGGTTAANNANNAATPSEALPPGGFRVPANTTWVATPLSVRRGDRVSFNTTGRIQLSDDAGDMAISAGSLRERRANGAPLPQHFAGALIAKIGNGAPFPIGDNSAPITMPANGQLYLGINDDEVNDNRGEF
ncbi:MAG: hypothetical protein M3478_00090, partial [Planctomycetota bacterium]|nr:hypothetical protein [Planctomycetota bacterium]